MRQVWRSGAGVMLAVTAAQAPAVPPAAVATGGGWTRDGWSDEAVGGVRSSDTAPGATSGPPGGGRPAESSPVVDTIETPAQAMPRTGTAPSDTTWDRTGTADHAARGRTWDGGRGHDYRYHIGGRLPAAFATPAYVVSDWAGYGLAAPQAGASWVRYFDDAVLVDRDGLVIDAVPGIGWAQPPRPYTEATAPIAPASRSILVEQEQRRTYTFTTPTTPGTTVSRSPDGRVTVTTVTTPSVSATTTDSR